MSKKSAKSLSKKIALLRSKKGYAFLVDTNHLVIRYLKRRETKALELKPGSVTQIRW